MAVGIRKPTWIVQTILEIECGKFDAFQSWLVNFGLRQFPWLMSERPRSSVTLRDADAASVDILHLKCMLKLTDHFRLKAQRFCESDICLFIQLGRLVNFVITFKYLIISWMTYNEWSLQTLNHFRLFRELADICLGKIFDIECCLTEYKIYSKNLHSDHSGIKHFTSIYPVLLTGRS